MNGENTGGSVRGNDQESIDRSKCMMTWRRRKNSGIETTYCEGGVEEVRARNGGLCGYRCPKCGAQYTTKRLLIRTPPKASK